MISTERENIGKKHTFMTKIFNKLKIKGEQMEERREKQGAPMCVQLACRAVQII